MSDIETQGRPHRASSQLTAIVVGQTRVETKIDHLLEKVEGTNKRVEELEETASDHSIRLTKLEGFQGIILWVINGGWAVVAGVGLLLAKLGVI